MFGTNNPMRDSMRAIHRISIALWLLTAPAWAAYEFSGLNNYLHVTDGNAIAQATPITVAAWIKPDTASGTDGIVDRDESSNSDRVFQFRLSDGTLQAICFVNDTTLQTASSASTVATGEWSFVAFTFDGSDIHVFINSGTSAGTAALSGNLSADATGISIGARSRYNALDETPADEFDGAVAEVACWNRVLSKSELDGLASGNSALFYTTDLDWYAPLVDDYVDDTGGMTFVALGTPTQVTHPTINMPSSGPTMSKGGYGLFPGMRRQ